MKLGFGLLHLLLNMLWSIPSNLLSCQSNVGPFPTCSMQMAFLRPGCRMGLLGSVGHQELCPVLQIPASKPAHLAQTKGRANLCSVFGAAAPQRWWDWGFCPGSLEAVRVAAQCGVASRAMQPACTFSCFVLKYPLVSFFTSYSLYPKLCIPPLHGVIFLIAGRVLLLDTSLLLMRCVALRRARWTYLILQTGRDESSCSSAANARPKMWLLPVRLIDKTLTWGKSLLESWSPALLSCWEARQCCEVQQHRLLTVRTVKCQPLHGENLMSCSTTGYWW